jgi:hypothetical protein
MNRPLSVALALAALAMVPGCDEKKAAGTVTPKPVTPVAKTPEGKAAASPMGGPSAGETQSGKVQVVNAWCPLDLDGEIAGRMANRDAVADFKGQKVGFCCEPCVAAWDKMTDADREKALAAAIAKPEEK